MSEPAQPGSPAVITTEADPADLDLLLADVRAAKRRADAVLVSLHWGLHFVPSKIADYETEVARAAIDAGADAVLGHHQHVLKGVQVYKGKPIFHGLGCFVVDVDLGPDSGRLVKHMQGLYGEYSAGYRHETPSFPFHPVSRHTGIAKCTFEDGRLSAVSFLPCMINAAGQPELLRRGDEAFRLVCDYLVEVSREAGFHTRFLVEGDELVVALDSEPTRV